MTGLDVFDTTVQKTNVWLKDIMQALGWEDRHKAYVGLRTTLHALRDRLTPEETAQFGAQYKEVAAYIASYMAAHPHTQLILSGHDDIVAGFRHWLAPSVQAQVLETVSLDMHDDRHRLLEVAQDVLQRHEREEELVTVQLLVHRAGHGGLAVLGLQATVEAVNTARVHKLVMQKDMHYPGWRCRTCKVLAAEAHLECVQCDGEVTTVELGEAMVQAVLQADGLVELIDPDPRLAAYEGVGALLRYQ